MYRHAVAVEHERAVAVVTWWQYRSNKTVCHREIAVTRLWCSRRVCAARFRTNSQPSQHEQ